MWRALLVAISACGFTGQSIRPADGGAADASAVDASAVDGSAADATAADASAVDASAATQPPVLAVSRFAANANAGMLSYTVTVPAGTDRFMLVSVQLGANCPADVAPSVAGVTYNGVALSRVTAILGTPCGAVTTRSEHWQLVAPPTGTHDVVVTLSAQAKSDHSGAFVFTGVDQTTPIRGSASASGTGALSSVSVPSATNDVVVDSVGQGNGITAPGAGQTSAFVDNVSTTNTLDNSAASTAPGAPTVTMTWTFKAVDEWQTIASAIRPD